MKLVSILCILWDFINSRMKYFRDYSLKFNIAFLMSLYNFYLYIVIYTRFRMPSNTEKYFTKTHIYILKRNTYEIQNNSTHFKWMYYIIKFMWTFINTVLDMKVSYVILKLEVCNYENTILAVGRSFNLRVIITYLHKITIYLHLLLLCIKFSLNWF